MKALVVGSGGREHALAWKLSQECEVTCAPGNPGIAQDCECVPIETMDAAGLIGLALDRAVDLMVIGPEDPLVAGLADSARSAGITVFGPSAAGAQLEGSKAFSKKAMIEAGVPTAEGRSFSEAEAARSYVRDRFAQGKSVAVKASGNALGKGVVVCESQDEALEAVALMMERREFGDAGATVVIEDRLTGREFSLLTLVGERNFVSLPVAQDYKRISDGNLGPNTGGMGSYSPVSWVDPSILEETERRIIAPMIEFMRANAIDYRGTLFSGVMVQDGRPMCIEYNVRFGDPETQSILSRLGSGFANALLQAASGRQIVAPEVLDMAAVTVVAASAGYPGTVVKGLPIEIGSLPSGVKIFHAGTKLKDGGLATNGGRVLGVAAVANSLSDARSKAYEGMVKVHFDGLQFRSDIARDA